MSKSKEENNKADWGNLFDLFKAHIEKAVQQQLKEKIEEVNNKVEFLTLPEVERRTGITVLALRRRAQRGTIKLHGYGSKTLLMSWDEYQKLLAKIKPKHYKKAG